jgi:hypothetical protein
MKQKDYRKLTLWLIAAWFVFALSASALHLFRGAPTAPPIAVGLGVLMPIAIFAAWFRLSPGFREFALALNPRMLTMIHMERLGGFVFLALYTYHILPGFFALPAGLGDIAIGATALLVANKLADPNHRTGFIVWQVLGMADLALAVTLASMSRFINPGGITTAPMTELPMSLIPTFAVPLLFILHLICVAQARRWHAPLRARGVETLPSSAM